MSLISIVLIGIGLSMDAFAISLTVGMNTSKEEKGKMALKASGYFGGLQGLMPLIGWAIGISFASYIENIDHWVAFILLAIIGGKMVFESFKDDEDSEGNKETKEYSNKKLLVLAIATSIDALAVGIGFAFLSVNIIYSILVIGIVTFIICIIGVFLGKALGNIFSSKAELLGGIILIIIGLKILVEHLFM